MNSSSTHNDVTALEFCCCCRRKTKKKRRRAVAQLGIAERALDEPRNLTSTSLQPPRHLNSNIKNHNNKIEKRTTIKEGIKTFQGGSPNGGGASLPVITIRIDNWRKSTQNRRSLSGYQTRPKEFFHVVYLELRW
jgi:hypothetical protein